MDLGSKNGIEELKSVYELILKLSGPKDANELRLTMKFITQKVRHAFELLQKEKFHFVQLYMN